MAKRTKSRGRNLKRTETQAAINVSRYVTNERKRTDGTEKVAISAASPRLRRKTPRVSGNPDMPPREYPADAIAHVTKRGHVKMVTWNVDPETLK